MSHVGQVQKSVTYYYFIIIIVYLKPSENVKSKQFMPSDLSKKVFGRQEIFGF